MYPIMAILITFNYCNNRISCIWCITTTICNRSVLGANIGTTGTIWLAGIMVSDGLPQGITKQIALVHTGVNALMAIALLPFVQPIARFISKF